MTVFILSSVSIALFVYYLLYMQIFGGIIKSKSEIVKHITIFVLLYSVMLLIGYLTSSSLYRLIGSSSPWISMALFFFMGLKLYKSVLGLKNNIQLFDTANFKILFLFVLTHSFDAFICGMALGFYSNYSYTYLIVFALILILFLYLSYLMSIRTSATKSVWMFASFGASLMGINAIIIFAFWLFSLF